MTRLPMILLAAVALPATTTGLCAQVQDQVIVNGTAQGAEGRLAVNIASGTENQQMNDAALAAGNVVSVSSVAVQHLDGNSTADRSTRIELAGAAFANSHGLASINITAGSQNQSANQAVIAVGNYGAISDALLAQSRASTEPSGLTGGVDARNDHVVVSDDAFRDSSGLIQVNLIGGERNSSANTFALTVLGEGSP